MKVTGPTGPSGAGGARPAQGQSAAPGFQPITTSAASGAAGVTTAGAVSHISSLQALIALQVVDGPIERRRRAMGRAGKLLDALDGLKLDLLDGNLSQASMEALTRAVRDQQLSRCFGGQPALRPRPDRRGEVIEARSKAGSPSTKSITPVF